MTSTKTNNDDTFFPESQISGAARTTTRAGHPEPAAMVAEASRGVETRARKRKRDLDAQAGVAIPGLPFDVAVSLVEKHLPDPADLAVLRAVSKGMRDAVDATGRKIEVVDELKAAGLGYLTTLKSLRRRGSLKNESLPCAAAARSGDLEELKALRESKVCGTGGRPRSRRGAATSRCCSGRTRMAARGTRGRACGRLGSTIPRR